MILRQIRIMWRVRLPEYCIVLAVSLCSLNTSSSAECDATTASDCSNGDEPEAEPEATLEDENQASVGESKDAKMEVGPAKEKDGAEQEVVGSNLEAARAFEPVEQEHSISSDGKDDSGVGTEVDTSPDNSPVPAQAQATRLPISPDEEAGLKEGRIDIARDFGSIGEEKCGKRCDVSYTPDQLIHPIIDLTPEMREVISDKRADLDEVYRACLNLVQKPATPEIPNKLLKILEEGGDGTCLEEDDKVRKKKNDIKSNGRVEAPDCDCRPKNGGK